MSSPMMTRMLGFCCANAGAIVKINKECKIDKKSRTFRVIFSTFDGCPAFFLPLMVVLRFGYSDLSSRGSAGEERPRDCQKGRQQIELRSLLSQTKSDQTAVVPDHGVDPTALF